MKGFKDLEFKSHPHHNDGIVSRIHFSNGYGVSVVRHSASYGSDLGLYELAVVDASGVIIYDTQIAKDVIGWLRPQDVTEVMEKIQEFERLQ
jgi:hypothetical protein